LNETLTVRELDFGLRGISNVLFVELHSDFAVVVAGAESDGIYCGILAGHAIPSDL
jgi:hypothetical protein